LYDYDKTKLNKNLIQILKKYNSMSFFKTDFKNINHRLQGTEYFAEDAICITLTDIDLHDRFIDFVNSIRNNYLELKLEMNDTKNFLSPLSKILDEWYKLFQKNPRNQQLTMQSLIGLFGELLIFDKLSENTSFELTENAWQNQPDQDFVFQNTCFEIKTSSLDDNKVVIHGLAQLNRTDELPINLISVQISESENGITIHDIVKRCITHFNDFSENDILERFKHKLYDIGYRFDSDEKIYTIKFITNNIETYDVNDNFPKLPNSNFPSPIIEAEYVLDLDRVDKSLLTDLNSIINDNEF